MLNNLLQMNLRLLRKEQLKTAEPAGCLSGNKFDDKITRVSKLSAHNNSETKEEEILREGHVSTEKKEKIIDDLILI